MRACLGELRCTWRAENFRIFGSAPQRRGDDDESLRIDVGPGISVLAGENDSGKTAIVDASRLCLLTAAADFYRITKDDFTREVTDGRTRSPSRARSGVSLCRSMGTFLELVTTEECGETALYVTSKAQLMDPLRPSRVSVTTRTGTDGKGPALDGAARELLKATYLRPLRDAEVELRSGRESRLSHILSSYPASAKQTENDFDADNDTATMLLGILSRAEHHLAVPAGRSLLHYPHLA